MGENKALIPNYKFDSSRSAKNTLEHYDRIITAHGYRVKPSKIGYYQKYVETIIQFPEALPDIITFVFQVLPYLEKGAQAVQSAAGTLF